MSLSDSFSASMSDEDAKSVNLLHSITSVIFQFESKFLMLSKYYYFYCETWRTRESKLIPLKLVENKQTQNLNFVFEKFVCFLIYSFPTVALMADIFASREKLYAKMCFVCVLKKKWKKYLSHQTKTGTKFKTTNIVSAHASRTAHNPFFRAACWDIRKQLSIFWCVWT